MLYAILCYDSEDAISAWTKEQDDAAMVRLGVVQEKLKKEKRLGPVARLMPTTTASTLRKGAQTIVLDGPFAETKEQLLGFFIVECASLEEALETAKELGRASSSAGAYEIRPLRFFGGGIAGIAAADLKEGANDLVGGGTTTTATTTVPAGAG